MTPLPTPEMVMAALHAEMAAHGLFIPVDAQDRALLKAHETALQRSQEATEAVTKAVAGHDRRWDTIMGNQA